MHVKISNLLKNLQNDNRHRLLCHYNDTNALHTKPKNASHFDTWFEVWEPMLGT